MSTPLRLLFAASLALAALPARAADPWGLEFEKPLTFKAKVVDLVCALTGDCPADCGGGKRQFGLLMDDGTLRAAVKGAYEFAGVADDLAPYCNRTVFVDGLLVENPKMTMYFVQSLREREDQPWQPTEAFKKAWSARNGESDEWYRKDPDVKRIIADGGVFGIPGLKSKSSDVRDPALKAAP